jgi:cytochrome c biogenesis protein CcdA
MERAEEIKALEELRQSQIVFKKQSRIVFIFIVITASILMIMIPTIMPRPVYILVMVASMLSIFGLVFLGRVGLILTKRRFGLKRPHRRLAQLSEPDDLELDVIEALKMIDERQEKELQKRRL